MDQAFESTAMENYQIYETRCSEFDNYYHALPSDISKNHLENGNRIVMPASALYSLSMLDIDYPMLFRIENAFTGHHSHCGVIEFTAEEGFVFLPSWLMKNLHLIDNDLVNIKNTSLSKGSYMKIQPHLTKFLSISDHKSVLEKAMKEFACLTVGDTITINHMDEKYSIDIVELKPSPAVSLFETDCEVDFAQPLDYKEPEKEKVPEIKQKKDDQKDDIDEVVSKFKAFTGVARRLNGEKIPRDETTVITESKAATDRKTEMPKAEFKPFTGVGRQLDGQPLLKEGQSGVQAANHKDKLEAKNTTEESKKFQPFTRKIRILGA